MGNEARASTDRALPDDIRDLALEDGLPAGTERRQKGDELQEKAIALAKDRQNIFLTGKAGTGKSWTTRRIVEYFRNEAITTHVTAPTGVAAINVGGETIHKWGNFQKGEYYSDFNKMMSEETRETIEETKVLLIDEISMVDGHFLDVLECIVAIIRCYSEVRDRLKAIQDEADNIVNHHVLEMRWSTTPDGLADIPPWGGIQLIVIGDFFQLPPVPNSSRRCSGDDGRCGNAIEENDELCEEESDLLIGRQGSYAFQSHSWQKSEMHTIELETVHRQTNRNDGLFELLNDMREGKTSDLRSPRHSAALSALRNPLPLRSDGIVPTRLHARNRDVDAVNRNKLAGLEGEEILFVSIDEVIFDQKYKSKVIKKYGLECLTGLPFLFGSVEAPPVPEALQQARNGLAELEEKKREAQSDRRLRGLDCHASRLDDSKRESGDSRERRNSQFHHQCLLDSEVYG